MIIDSQAQATDAAILQAMASATDPRLREIAASFVRHMHGFV
ncbi:hypothetical protein [Acidisphaera sp. L21]|jgi:hypothetical protein|nr:hypothetical protein [Acidisphaera sp. L21]